MGGEEMVVKLPLERKATLNIVRWLVLARDLVQRRESFCGLKKRELLHKQGLIRSDPTPNEIANRCTTKK